MHIKDGEIDHPYGTSYAIYFQVHYFHNYKQDLYATIILRVQMIVNMLFML